MVGGGLEGWRIEEATWDLVVFWAMRMGGREGIAITIYSQSSLIPLLMSHKNLAVLMVWL